MSRVLFNQVPVASPWHLPMGISYLTALLEARGHQVVQRYSYLTGLEWVLTHEADPTDTATVSEAIQIYREAITQLDPLPRHHASRTLERASRSVHARHPAAKKFAVERNNVYYQGGYFDGSVASILREIQNRVHNLWFRYFQSEEVPVARKFQPDIYGISVNDERQLVAGWVLAAMIKEVLPSTLVVLGGNFWSRVVDGFRQPESAELFDHVDCVITNEGFNSMLEIAETMSPTVPGACWRDGETVRFNAKPSYPFDFSLLPPPVFDSAVRQWSPTPVLPLYTMSNCPMRCGFCSISAGSDTFLGSPRALSPRQIAEQMKLLGQRYETTRFDFQDEMVAINRQLELGRELKRLVFPATWQCYMTITDQLLKIDVCRRLYDAGCRAVQLGLESMADQALATAHKRWNHPRNYGKILRNLRAAGIQTHVFIMVGLPGEQVRQTLAWPAFLEEFSGAILTIKHSRYRLSNRSPDEAEGRHSSSIAPTPRDSGDHRPFRLNRTFRYAPESGLSGHLVEAQVLTLEEACRRHRFYEITSTLQWWANRGEFTWEELEQMAARLTHEPAQTPNPDLPKSIARLGRTIGQPGLCTYDDLLRTSREELQRIIK